MKSNPPQALIPVKLGQTRVGWEDESWPRRLGPSPPYIVCTRDLGQYWVGNRCYIAWFVGVLPRSPTASRLEPR